MVVVRIRGSCDGWGENWSELRWLGWEFVSQIVTKSRAGWLEQPPRWHIGVGEVTALIRCLPDTAMSPGISQPMWQNPSWLTAVVNNWFQCCGGDIWLTFKLWSTRGLFVMSKRVTVVNLQGEVTCVYGLLSPQHTVTRGYSVNCIKWHWFCEFHHLSLYFLYSTEDPIVAQLNHSEKDLTVNRRIRFKITVLVFKLGSVIVWRLLNVKVKG